MIPARKDAAPELPEWLQRAIDQFDKDAFNDGDTLSHKWMHFALDIPEPKNLAEVKQSQFDVLARVEAFKEWMLEKRLIALQSVRGEGYRIVPPRDQARFGAEEAMRMVKKGLQKGDSLMTNTRVGELSSEEKKRHTDAHLRLSGVAGLVSKQKRDIFKLLNAPASKGE